MSFLTETTIRRLATTLPRATSAAVTAHGPRAFSTTLAARKTPTESAKETLKKVDRTVSDKLVDTLNAAEAAKEKIEETAKKVTKDDVAGKAKEVKGEAKGKAHEVKGEAKGAAAQAEGKAKATAEEIRKSL